MSVASEDAHLALMRVTDAVVRLAEAEDDVKHLSVAAVEAGVPIAHVAGAAGVARTTIYRWIREGAAGEAMGGAQ